jgi:hypothetical protein
MAATPEHMDALTAIYYSLCRSICLAMTGLECKEVKHKDYGTEVVLMITHRRKTASLISVLTGSLQSMTTEIPSKRHFMWRW